MSEWQLIKTAPRTAKRILLGSNERDDAIAVCYWDMYYTSDGNGFTGGDGWVIDASGEEYYLLYDSPTHWMPLPAPPPGVSRE